MPLGQNVGKYRENCHFLYHEVGDEVLSSTSQSLIYKSFAKSLSAQGYDVVNILNTDFEEDFMDEYLRSEYKVSAKVIDANIDVCNSSYAQLLERKTNKYKGKLYLKIKWALFDNLNKRVVYKTETEGYANLKTAHSDGLDIMISRAFGMAAHNFGAQKDVHDLLFYGKMPNYKEQVTAQRPRHFDPLEEVEIHNPPRSHSPLTQHIERTQQVAVRIEAGIGHGSGFFITDQGYCKCAPKENEGL